MNNCANTQINPTQNSIGGFSKLVACAGYLFRYLQKIDENNL